MIIRIWTLNSTFKLTFSMALQRWRATHLYLLSHIINTTLSSTPQTFIYVSFLFLRCFFIFSGPQNILHALIQDYPFVGYFLFIFFFHIRVYYTIGVCVVCFSFLNLITANMCFSWTARVTVASNEQRC